MKRTPQQWQKTVGVSQSLSMLSWGTKSLLVGIAIIFVLPFTAPAQTSSVEQTLAPVRSDLVAIHWPDLTKLEKDVREQIAAAQDSLVAIVRKPATSETALSDAFGQLGRIYHAYSLTSPARECYLNASVLSPGDFRWVYFLGKLDQQEGKFDDAIRRYRVAHTLQPEYVAVPVNIGNVFLELNRIEDAKEGFAAALKIDQNNAAAHYGLGQVAMAERNYSIAVEHFEKVLSVVPAANRVHYSLAMAYRGLGELQKVKAHLAQQGPVGVLAADPLVDGLQELIEGERVHLSRGKVAFEAKRYSEAAAEFRKAVAARQDSVTARINLGAALSQLGDISGATEQFEEAVRIDPASTNAHYNLAILLTRQGKSEQAILHLHAVLDVDPNDISARYLLAQQLSKTGDVDEALLEFSHVIQANPNNEGALLEQVKLLYRKGRYKEALEATEKGQAQYPQKPRTVAMLAYLFATSPAYELRNGSRALELAQRLYTATRGTQAGVLVAIALAELGRCGEAATWQRKMMIEAEQQGNKDLQNSLAADLKLYDQPQSCRPISDSTLAKLPFLIME